MTKKDLPKLRKKIEELRARGQSQISIGCVNEAYDSGVGLASGHQTMDMVRALEAVYEDITGDKYEAEEKDG